MFKKISKLNTGIETNKTWKKSFIFHSKLKKSSTAPTKDKSKANSPIKAKLLSASPKKLTPIKKAIAVATPPRGGIFLSTSLSSSFFEDFLNFIDFAVYKIIQLNTPDKTKVKIAEAPQKLRDEHNISALVAVKNSEKITFSADIKL